MTPRPGRTLLLWLASLVGGGLLLWLVSRRLQLWPTDLQIPRPDLLLAAAALHVPYSLARSLRLRYALDPRVRAATGDPRARSSAWSSRACSTRSPPRSCRASCAPATR